ncbi:BON domain-containing protein [Deinococcus sp. SM5_A1]|uniref:BON domain-containing protein n=1 Tax=Deinococcus sp. SM5_A1 TaxID=3379094 RepID=UPI00385F10B8
MTQDQQLREHVMTELEFTPGLNAPLISVAVSGAVVTLTGTVNTYAQRQDAVTVTQRVNGVHGIANELLVRPAALHQRSDTEIARAAVDSLNWHWIRTLKTVKVKVEQGWVTLDGTLTWDYQRRAAHDAVAFLTGVRGVTNRIPVTPSTTPDQVESSIKRAFIRQSEQDARQVMVSVSGGQVILSGQTYSWAELEHAANAAWSAVGVTDVDNHIEVAAPAWPAL